MSKRGPLADPKVQEQLREQERLLSSEELQDLQQLLSTPWGRRFYYRIVYLLCGKESSSYAPSGQYMSFLEGRRDIAITLSLEAQDHFPDLWIRMLQERFSTAADVKRAHHRAITKENT